MLTLTRHGALALIMGAAAASPAMADSFWAACRAESPVKDGVVYAVDSGSFAVSPDFKARLDDQRPFEPVLRSLGATGLKDATARCTLPFVNRADAEAARKALRAERIAALGSPPPRLVEGPWTVVLERGSVPTALLVANGELASAQTLASSPAKWGLTIADFSREHDLVLLEKAGLPARRPELAAAAAKGDAYALYLLAARPGKDDDLAQMKLAADQGLVRASASYHFYMALHAEGAAAMPHILELRKLAALRSAHANFLFGLATVSVKGLPEADVREGMLAVRRAKDAKYAPAELWVAQVMLSSANLSDEERRQARDLAWDAHYQRYPGAKAVFDSAGAR